MSSISFRAYIGKAFEDPSGEVRIAKGTTDQLVNKGTIGNRIASFFQDAARAIGLMRPDPTRAQRQQDALDGFREALTAHFGQEAAAAGLQAAGLDVNGVALTGRVMIAAADQAKAAIAQNRAANLQAVDSYVPPDGDKLATIAARMKPPLNAEDLTAEQQQELTTRLRDAVFTESKLNRTVIADGRMAEIAKDTLKQVLQLSKVDGLDTARAAREAYTAALKDVIRGLASGKDANALVARLGTATARFQEHAVAERIAEVGGGEFQELTEQALLQAMRDLNAEDPALLRKAQQNAMKDGSPLRALSAAAQEVVRTAGFEEGSEARTRREAAGRMFSMASVIVYGLGSGLGSTTNSAAEDVNLLSDADTVPQGPTQKAARALDAMLAKVPIQLSMEESFLAELGKKHDVTNREEVQGAVDEFLKDQIEELNRDPDYAYSELQKAVEADADLSPVLKHMVSTAINNYADGRRIPHSMGDEY